MRSKQSSFSVKALTIVALTLLLLSGAWAKPKFRVLHGVYGGMFSGLTLDARGNLYGATNGGGTYGYGMIFELKRQRAGEWSEIVVHNFNGSDGSSPNGGMIFDGAGNVYGTTSGGGATYAGTVFELKPDPYSLSWTYSILYSFCPEGFPSGCPEGDPPDSGVVMDQSGALYGTTAGGGDGNGGVAYELTPGISGWAYTVIHYFGPENEGTDGWEPYAPLVRDQYSNLYGTTAGGGGYNLGTVFQLVYASGSWNENLLYSFCAGGFPCTDGAGPAYGLVLDQSGNLYGTTPGGGANSCGEANCGTVFELSPEGSGSWRETVLYNFRSGESGSTPTSGLVFDKAGDMFGTTAGGGASQCPYGCGVVYKLTPNADGEWKYTVMHKFNGADGAWPDGVVLDGRGNLYGPAYNVVFEITP